MGKKNGWSNGFSLIELLVVIAIVGVLFAVGLFVFENAGKKNPDRAAAELMGTMRLARQHAIAKRQWTFVVFPNRDGGPYTEAGGNKLERCLRGYAVLAAVNPMDGVALADQIPAKMTFAFVTDWKTLPEGVVFDDNAALSRNFVFGALNALNPTYTGAFSFPMDPANPTLLVRPMGAVLFKPNGRAFVMHDTSPGAHYWQDVDDSVVYMTSKQMYEEAAGMLTGPAPVPGGTTTGVRIRNKTGQVQLADGP